MTNSILNLEHDVNVLQQFLDHLVRSNPSIKFPSVDDVKRFRENAVTTLRQKYPNMQIENPAE